MKPTNESSSVGAEYAATTGLDFLWIRGSTNMPRLRCLADKLKNKKPKFEMACHLTPALSPVSRRRRRNVSSVFGTDGDGIGRMVKRTTKNVIAKSSPGGEDTGEGGLQTNPKKN